MDPVATCKNLKTALRGLFRSSVWLGTVVHEPMKYEDYTLIAINDHPWDVVDKILEIANDMRSHPDFEEDGAIRWHRYNVSNEQGELSIFFSYTIPRADVTVYHRSSDLRFGIRVYTDVAHLVNTEEEIICEWRNKNEILYEVLKKGWDK